MDHNLKENRDKLSPEDASAIEAALEKGREAVKGSDKAEMEKAIEEIGTASNKLAEILYAAQSAAGGGGQEEQPTAQPENPQDEDVVDAEFTDEQ